MPTGQWSVFDFWLETPSFGPGLHDLRGKGAITIDKDGVHAAIRLRGLAGFVMRKERRTFAIRQIRGWERTKADVEFTAGAITSTHGVVGSYTSTVPITTTGASVPVHVCRFTCNDPTSAAEMTRALLELGLDPSQVSSH